MNNRSRLQMKKTVSAVMQEVDAITNVSEHVAFVQQMLQKHSTSGNRKKELLKQLKFAERRAADPVLHLAVLGEFSSGKSTFINALLKQRLLKSARVATTASATYITFSPTLNVGATFLDGRYIHATALDTADLSAAIAQIKSNPVEILPIRKAIDLLTSDQAIADKINRVDISLPNRHLRSGLAIIDTPGIGAGGDYTRMHSQITQVVVEESADAAIVLIPSTQPMSSTLLSFLHSTARHFLHRCIFVVTAMDNQNPEDRSRVLGFVDRCLTEKLALKSPSLYDCAAITALPILGKIPIEKQPIWSVWQQQFSRLESTLFQEIVRHRNLIIAEKLIYLFRALFLELETDIQKRQAVIEQGAWQLRENSVEALDSVISRLLEQGIQEIRTQGNKCRVNTTASKSGFRVGIRAKVHSIIDSASRESIHNYAGAVKPELGSAAEAECRQFLHAVDGDVQQLNQCFQAVLAEFTYQFEKSYTTLTSFSSDVTIPAVILSPLSISAVGFSSAISLAKQVQQEDNQRTGRGAYIGAAVGFLVMGPFGAAAGAALGGVTGNRGKKNLDDYRREIKHQVDDDIDQYVDRYVSEVVSAIDLLEKKALSELRAIAQAHLVEYGTVVNNMLEKHSARERRLTLKANDIRRDMSELTRRQQKLKDLSRKLTTV